MKIKNLIGKYGVVTIIAIILGIALALQIKTTNVSAYESRDIIELQNNVRSYAEKNAELNERNASLYEEIEKLREDQAKGDIYYEDILQEKEKMAIFAGLTAVQNSGIVINMGMTGQSMISDSYLRLIVNELNTLGAQAISINDQRKVATTEIRATSENIIINGVGYPRNEDFVIKAIINPDQQASAIITLETLKKSIQDREDADHQLDMSIAAEDKVIIPALSEDSIVYKTDLLRPVDDD